MEFYLIYMYFFKLFLFAVIFRMLGIKQQIDFDAFGHFYFAKCLRQQAKGCYGPITTNVATQKPEEHFFHAMLWNWCLSKLGDPVKLLRWQHWFNPLLDATALFMFCLLAFWSKLDIEIIIVTAFLYLFTPALFTNWTSGPRLRSTTPRLSSEVVFTLILLCFIFQYNLPIWLTGLIVFLGSFYILAASKFGRQAWLFTLLPTAIILFNPILLLAIIFSVLTKILFWHKYFLKSLADQAGHLALYASAVWNRNSAIDHRANTKKFFEVLKAPSSQKKIIRAYQVALFNGWIYSLLFFPIFWLTVFSILFLYFFHQPDLDATSAYITHLYIVVVIAGSVFFLTNLRVFLFLGESERYLTHTAFIICLAGVVAFEQLGLSLLSLLVILYGMVVWFLEHGDRIVRRAFVTRLLNQVWSVIGYSKLSQDHLTEEDRIIRWLQGFEEPQTVLSYPYHAVGVWRIMLQTDHRVIFPSTKGKQFQDYFEQNFQNIYPYVNLDALERMTEELQVRVIIMHNGAWHMRRPDWQPDPSLWKTTKTTLRQFTLFVHHSVECYSHEALLSSSLATHTITDSTR